MSWDSQSRVTDGELETPNVTLSFWEREREEPFVANEAGFGLRVDDVDAVRAELETKRVVFIAETWNSGVCHFAAFRDLDGNTLILHRRYAPRTELEPAEDSSQSMLNASQWLRPRSSPGPVRA